MSVSPRLTRLIRQTLYDLKIAFGQQVSVYKIESSDTNYETGEKQISTVARLVKKAIVLPSDQSLQILQGVNYLAASKVFTSLGGGTWDSTQRAFIFDGVDAVDGIGLTDYLVLDGQRYDVASIEALTGNLGFLVVGKHVLGQPSGGVVSENVSQSTGLTDGSEAA